MGKISTTWIVTLVILGLLMIFVVPFIISLISSIINIIPPPGKIRGKRAVIVDTVCLAHPNDESIKYVYNILKENKFEVEIFVGKNVTVKFMRSLALRNYSLVIFRVHSSYTHYSMSFLPNNTVVIITGERYQINKYAAEQLLEYLVPSSVVPELGIAFGYFAITPRFVENMPGKFDNTVIISMGCNTLYTPGMAKAFIDKGAKMYIGWDDYVSTEHMDKALKLLIKLLLKDKLSIKEAIKKVNEVIGLDPYYKSKLVYYPLEYGDMTLEDLLKP